MSDEIRKEDLDELEKVFNQLKEGGKIKATPNLTHLPAAEKERMAKEVLQECAEKLFRAYLSLGINGEAILEGKEPFSGIKFRLHFKSEQPEEGGD